VLEWLRIVLFVDKSELNQSGIIVDSILEMTSFENVDGDSEAQQALRRIRKAKSALTRKESQHRRDCIKVNDPARSA
jgi:hypothetical protein